MSGLLEVEGLRITVPGGRTVVDGVDLAVERGGALGLLGASGAGKTLIALSLLGLTGPAVSVAGSVRFDGRELLGLDRREWRAIRGRRVAMVFQDPLGALHPTLRIGRQVEEALRAGGLRDRRGRRARAAELLERVGLGGRARALPMTLSGGMRQRAVLAVALANSPDLLVADEPTSALDVTTQAQVLELVAGLRAELGMALVLITHDLAVLAGATAEMAVLSSGRVVERGPVGRLLAAPTRPETRALVAGAVAGRPRRPRRWTGEGPPALAVSGLVRTYGTVRAVDGVELTVAPGEAVGLVGESGCGKSTLARTALGLERADGGAARVEGVDVAGVRGAALLALRRAAAIVPQDGRASLDPRLTVGACVAEPLIVHGVVAGEAARRDRVAGLLERVGLDPDMATRRPSSLSGGEAQRVAIARALATGPRLLVADEPVTALDAAVRSQVLDLLAELRDDLGLAVLLISHDLEVVRRVCDRVAVMVLGRIVETGPAEDLLARPRHPYTAALIAAVPRLGRGPSVLARGEPGSAQRPPTGCRYHPRCPQAVAHCVAVEPVLDGSGTACHFPLDDAERRAWLGQPSSSSSSSSSPGA